MNAGMPDPAVAGMPEAAGTKTERAFAKVVLRLVKGGPEREAIESGQIDAIVDRSSGDVILLPAAQRALIERKVGFRSLVGLSTDGTWEQDERYHFTSYTGGAGTRSGSGDEAFIGKALWDLKMEILSEVDWQTHRQQLEWRASFRNLEVRQVGGDGQVRYLSFSGEPMIGPQEQFRGYRGITHDITAHKQSEVRALESSRVARAVFEALAAQVAVLDASGKVILANQAWLESSSKEPGIGADVAVGGNYLAACDRADGEERVDGIAIAAGLRQVIEGARELYYYEHAVGPPGARRWFALSITAADGGAIVSRDDITLRKRDEELLQLEFAVSRALARADDADSALRSVIRAVCETQAWDCGRYFRLDTASGLLRYETSWGRGSAEVERFLERSRHLVFRPGSGLAGRVFQSGEPLWVSGGRRDARVSRTALAPESGRDGAFVFPVTVDEHPIGVLAFSSTIVRAPEDRLLQSARGIGDQLGRFLLQRRALDDLRHREARFRKLTELSADFYWEQDRDFRFTEFVGGALAGAGSVVGKTLWELSNLVAESAEWDEHRSRLAARWSFCDFEFRILGSDGQQDHICISGEPIFDASGAFAGYCGTGLDITERKQAGSTSGGRKPAAGDTR